RRSGPAYGLEQIAQAARKLDAPHELRCLESSLQTAIDSRARRGDALYLSGNPDGALAEHRRVLAESRDYPESLFFVGAILLEQNGGDKAKLEEGKKYWRRLLAVAPDSPRASIVKESLPRADEIFAKRPVAQGELPAGHPDVAGQLPPGHPDLGAQLPEGHPSIGGSAPDAPMAHRGATPEERPNVSPQELQAVAEAAQNTERTPELEKGLDELTVQAEALLDQGKYQEARDRIVRVMPMRPNDARTAAVMGGAMRGLGRDAMAERTLSRALQIDPRQPRALYEMGRLLASRGDKAAAAEKLRAAQAADPKFAQSHRLEQELARLKYTALAARFRRPPFERPFDLEFGDHRSVLLRADGARLEHHGFTRTGGRLDRGPHRRSVREGEHRLLRCLPGELRGQRTDERGNSRA